MKRYQNVGVRIELILRIKELIKRNIGYRSISEFVNESIRLRLEQLQPLIERKLKG
ncbi:MAG: hypothetical protein J7K23_02005 [Thermoproteales archaeon]|nr:hypothetical protein [Thermoproteales archaeon]